MTQNLLADETSPYLLQHADNPVHWYPWGEAALAQAEKQQKPILLSIGYAACHWCHVMAHESFEDPDTAEVMRNGEPVPVSRIEFFVLAELIGAKGRVLSRDHLLRKVWGYGNAGDGRVVDNLIYRLRNKIEDDPANPELLLTVRGFGYRMKA